MVWGLLCHGLRKRLCKQDSGDEKFMPRAQSHDARVVPPTANVGKTGQAVHESARAAWQAARRAPPGSIMATTAIRTKPARSGRAGRGVYGVRIASPSARAPARRCRRCRVSCPERWASIRRCAPTCSAGFQPARRSALRGGRPPGAAATVPLHHPPGAGQRSSGPGASSARPAACGEQAQDAAGECRRLGRPRSEGRERVSGYAEPSP